MKQASSWKSDPIRDAEARIRALTHEVGGLREDLRRETKRRERAVARTRECEQLQDASQARMQQLEFAQLKLTQQLQAAQTTARASNDSNKKVLDALKSGLSKVEAAVAHRFKVGQQNLQGAFVVVRELRRLLFTPHPLLPDGSPLAHVATQEAQQSLQQLMHALGNVEGVFAGGLEDVAAALPGMDAADACAGCRSSSSSSGQQGQDVPHHANGVAEGNGGPVAAALQLRAMQEVQQHDIPCHDEVATLQRQVEQLSAALAEAEQQRGALRQHCEQLQQGSAGTSALQQELEMKSASLVEAELQRRALQQEAAALQQQLQEVSRRCSEAAAAAQLHQQRAQGDAAARAELEASRAQLLRQVGSLQEGCRAAEAASIRLQASEEGLQAALCDRDHQISKLRSQILDHQSQISQLQSQILDQQADIRSALALVSARKQPHSSRPGAGLYSPRPRPASADMAYAHPPSTAHFRTSHHLDHNHPTSSAPFQSVHTSSFPPHTHSTVSPNPPLHPQHPYQPNPYNPPATSHPQQQHPPYPPTHSGPPGIPSTTPYPNHPSHPPPLPPHAVAQAFHSLSTSSSPGPPPPTHTPAPLPSAPYAPALASNNQLAATHSPISTSITSAAPPNNHHSAPWEHPAHAPASSTSALYQGQQQQQQGQHPQGVQQLPAATPQPPRAGLQHIGQLKRDMQDLDSDIAELEANLKAATLRLS